MKAEKLVSQRMQPKSPGIDWENRDGLPRAARAVLCALRFDSRTPRVFAELTEQDWRDFLTYCDRMKVTLIVADRWLKYFPEPVRLRVEHDLANNRLRYQRHLVALREIDAAFRTEQIEYLLLKGFSHGPEYVSPTWLRHQCDLDFYHPPESISAA